MATTIPTATPLSLPVYLQRTLKADNENFEIRLLDVQSGNGGETLQCELRIVQLFGPESYEALSYTWGSHVLDSEIYISGHRVGVTHNLCKALHRLRSRAEKRTLWIDQLCINQADSTERANQVAVMQTIYTRCSSCIVWLGELDEEQTLFSDQDAQAVVDFIHFAADANERAIRAEIPVLFENTTRGLRARAAFEAFSMYGNPWWSRVWTIQEAIVPRVARFLWGSMSLPREIIYLAVHNLHGNIMPKLFSAEFCALRIHYTPLLRRLLYPIRGFLHYHEGESPLDFLMRWRHRDSSDPRDKVYALRGLLPPKELPSAIPCSYVITPAHLFEQITLDQIRREGGLRALVASAEIPHVTKNLASWAIDFACSNRVGKRQLKWWTHSHRYQRFAACGDYKLPLPVSSSGKTIALSGVFVDEVKMIGGVYSIHDTESVDNMLLLRRVLEARDLVQKYHKICNASTYYHNGQTWDAAFWRTMVGDYIMKEFPVARVAPEHEGDFSSLLSDLGNTIAKAEPTSSPVHGTHVLKTEVYQEQDLQDVLSSMAYNDTNHNKNILYESLCGMLLNNSFFVTSDGYIGIGPPDTRDGDQIWVFYGGQVPFVMRDTAPRDSLKKYQNLLHVGDAYVHGIMDGEAVRDMHKVREVQVF